MNWAYNLSGGAPLKKRYKIAASVSTLGIPLCVTADATAGLALGLTTAAADAVGVSLDLGTYSTTQGDTEGTVNVVINPDAVYKTRLCSGATAGAQLTVTTNSAAETAGTVVTITTGDPAPNSPTMDEGTIVCISGANVGQTRKVTSVGATAATVTVPFLNDIAAGDIFIIVPLTPQDVAADNANLTSNLAEARIDIAVATGAAVNVLDLEFDCASVERARLYSYAYLHLDDHVLNTAT